MFKFLRKKKGQSTLEYAVLMVIIVGALLSIQMYLKRGLQGRLKSATDDIGDQFSPGNTNALRTTITHSSTNQTFLNGVSRDQLSDADPETVDVSSSMNILNVEREFWGKEPPTTP